MIVRSGMALTVATRYAWAVAGASVVFAAFADLAALPFTGGVFNLGLAPNSAVVLFAVVTAPTAVADFGAPADAPSPSQFTIRSSPAALPPPGRYPESAVKSSSLGV